jgi:hypothetical protein
MDRPTHNTLQALYGALRGLVESQYEQTRALIEQMRQDRGQDAPFEMEYYEYVFTVAGAATPFVNLAATVGARAEGVFQTSTESDFYGTALLATARLDAGAAGDGAVADHYLTKWERQGDDRVATNAFLHVSNGWGTGQRPKYLDRPEWIRGGSTVKVEFQNRAAVALNLYHSMGGYKVRDKDLASHTRKS